jgi:hypothetical protein
MSQIANLSWFERVAASTLFAELPDATHHEALEHCLKAEHFSSSSWKENCLLKAKCFIGLYKYDEAVSWLNHASQAPVMIPDVSQNIIR